MLIRINVQHLKFSVVGQDVEKLGLVKLGDVALVYHIKNLANCHISLASEGLTNLTYH